MATWVAYTGAVGNNDTSGAGNLTLGAISDPVPVGALLTCNVAIAQGGTCTGVSDNINGAYVKAGSIVSASGLVEVSLWYKRQSLAALANTLVGQVTKTAGRVSVTLDGFKGYAGAATGDGTLDVFTPRTGNSAIMLGAQYCSDSNNETVWGETWEGTAGPFGPATGVFAQGGGTGYNFLTGFGVGVGSSDSFVNGLVVGSTVGTFPATASSSWTSYFATFFYYPPGSPGPIVTDKTFSTFYNTPLHVFAPGLLASDSGTLGSSITVTSNTNPNFGGLSAFGTDGSFIYTPNLNFSGTDTFLYKVTDGNGRFGTATVTIIVTGPTMIPPTLTTPGNLIDVITTQRRSK